jgi:hypothetical protein
MKNLFDNLKSLMNRYDLYQPEDEVGVALNELETAIKTETRVYVLDCADVLVSNVPIPRITDEEFMLEAEKQGNVYTLDGFANAFNSEKVNTATDMVRFIEVPVHE